MTYRHWTILLCVLATVVLIGWDCVCLANQESGDTVSEVVRSANRASGGLVSLLSAALWIHFFVTLPESWR